MQIKLFSLTSEFLFLEEIISLIKDEQFGKEDIFLLKQYLIHSFQTRPLQTRHFVLPCTLL